MGYKKRYYCADFETNNSETECRVWAWGLHEIHKPREAFQYGSDIGSFMWKMRNLRDNPTIFFHNLRFDGQFIIYWLLHNGYTYNHNPKELVAKSFTTVISEQNVFYQIKVCESIWTRKDNGKRVGRYFTFQDSLKKLPFPVKSIAKAFKLDMVKGEIDYKYVRPLNHVITPQELDYLKRDVLIMSEALAIQLDEGLDKMTIGADCLSFFKEQYKKKEFEKLFPVIELELFKDLLKAYRGGWVYTVDGYCKRDLGKGLVYDVNSLYPSVMADPNNPYPVGEPVYYTGKYEQDDDCPLYIQHFNAIFKLKDGKLPTIQVKNNPAYAPNKYVTESDMDKPTELWLCSVDLELFFKQYDVMYIEWLDGYKFAQKYDIFKDYVKYWGDIKEASEGAKRTLAKLELNNLYGKMATNKIKKNKYPYLDENDVVKYTLEKYEYETEEGEKATRDFKVAKGVYIPIGVFITAYARRVTITAAQLAHDEGIFAYADTDSIHLISEEEPDYIDIDDKRLGAWKLEGKFDRARYLGAKKYLEEEEITQELYEKKQSDPDCDNKSDFYFQDGKYWCKVLKCAGMNDAIKEDVDWENFYLGFSSGKKLKPKNVPGGCILIDSPFEIRT